LVGVIGSLQATEAIKLLCDIGEPLVGRLLMIDARRADFTTVRMQRQHDCPVCGAAAPPH